MPRTRIRAHYRKGRKVRSHLRKIKIPQRKGSLWKGEKNIHGPRKKYPDEFSRIWISDKSWAKKKYIKKTDIQKIRKFAKKQKLELKKGFPKTIKIKMGPLKKNGFAAQSLLTPLASKPKGYILLDIHGEKPKFTKEEKKKFDIIEDNFGSFFALSLLTKKNNFGNWTNVNTPRSDIAKKMTKDIKDEISRTKTLKRRWELEDKLKVLEGLE